MGLIKNILDWLLYEPVEDDDSSYDSARWVEIEEPNHKEDLWAAAKVADPQALYGGAKDYTNSR